VPDDGAIIWHLMDDAADRPTKVYRGFTSPEHVREFVGEGIIAFRRIDSYRTIEDAQRVDANEGEAMLQTPTPDGQDVIDFHMTSPAPAYVLCLSTSEAAAREFGGHVVRINEPWTLVQDVISYNRDHPPIPYPRVIGGFVVYNRGARVPVDPDIDEWIFMRCFQKAPSFAPQREYRIALIVTRSYRNPLPDPTDERAFVRLNRRLTYCELLPPAS
jgi:hypothetical protein